MDKTIRRNEICVIGQPRCDFVFSSTRSCFIAYGFEDSALEMAIIRSLLEQRGIQAVEAGGALSPGQNAFCAKICSKIITSQFCIALLNNDQKNGNEIPNANVNMEYGLMIGFNKYVIPFQRETQKLPFNVAGLDTIKYSNSSLEERAARAIDQAISETQQDAPTPISIDQILESFLLTQKVLVTPLNNEGERNFYQMGQPLGFNLVNDFTGFKYIYLGNFSALRPEAVCWRVKMLAEILNERRSTLTARVAAQIATAEQAQFLDQIIEQIQIWLIVTSDEDVENVKAGIEQSSYPVKAFSLEDVKIELGKLDR